MSKLLLCDPEKKNYDIRKLLASSGVSDFEVIEEADTKKAQERIEKGENFDAAVFGYEFDVGDSFGTINFLNRHREIPSIVLVYPSEMGVSNYARKRGIASVYRNDINFYLGDMIKKKTSK